MSAPYECETCGLSACDLPDVVDPELFFESGEWGMHCPTCDPPMPDDDEIAEGKLRARDYEAWANL